MKPSKVARVVAAFDGGQVTTDAGALLLGAANRAIGLMRRLARCFTDGRAPELAEHTVEAMLMQRICGIAPGCEDLVDDELRHDPVLAALSAGSRRGAKTVPLSHAQPARSCAGLGAPALPQDRA